MAFIYKSTNEPQGIHSGSAVATLLGVSPEGSPVEVTADSFVRAASIVPLSGNPTLEGEGATGVIVPTVDAMKRYIADVGVIGDTGPRGYQGYQGPQGEDGPQGPRGYQGDKGNDGTSVTIVGQVEDESELPNPLDYEGNLGDGYLVNGNLYVLIIRTDSGDRAWDNVGRIQGPQGVTGPQGPQGVTGTFNTSDWTAIVNLFQAHGIKLEEGTISVTQRINAANGFFQVNNVQ